MKRERVELVDLQNLKHCEALIDLLNEYMKGEMGMQKQIQPELAPMIVEGLKRHSAYVGFLVQVENRYVGLANCNLNFSTWKAKPIINIHDFIIHTRWRKKGMGVLLLNETKQYALKSGCCRMNLEVCEDNTSAKVLYRNMGFEAGNPETLFWELSL